MRLPGSPIGLGHTDDVTNPIALQTVLIVDDDRVNRTMLAELLHGECRIVLAKDGMSALRRVEEDATISLVLLDVSMPTMDGYDVLRRLRADPRTADIPVVFITGQTAEEDEERGLSLGAMDYVSKPVRPAIVRARIRNHLRLIAQRRALERLAGRDGLTGITNRRQFDELLALMCRLTSRTGEPIGLAMIDVDHFKQYNDHYGHGAGDDALRQVARVVGGYARRPYDVAARYGGEEFVLLLPHVTQLDTLLEMLRRDILALALPHAASPTGDVVSVSIGGVTVTGQATRDPESVLRHADGLLYEAKRQGRNRVVSETMEVG